MYFPQLKYFPAIVKTIFLYNYSEGPISIELESTFTPKMRTALHVEKNGLSEPKGIYFN